MNSQQLSLSIVLPAKNEAKSLSSLLPELKEAQPEAEIIVVNDGSTDNTEQVCEQASVKMVKHFHSMGNGAAIKSGARAATGDVIVFMDADGQHQPSDIGKLLQPIVEQGYEMVVGARDNTMHASWGRKIANGIYNKLASAMTGQKILDLTSGFRAVKRKRFLELAFMLPNKFSYPTTITMAFQKLGYPVHFVPIDVKQREGKSHINPWKDGIRFLLIIFKVGTLHSPMKIFFPVSAITFLTGLFYYLFTFFSSGRFTNMSLLLFISSALIFLLGLISEQLTQLLYCNVASRDRDDQ